MVRIIASSVELAQNSQSTSLEDDSDFVSSHLLGLAGRPLLHLIFLPFLPMFCWPYPITKNTRLTRAKEGQRHHLLSKPLSIQGWIRTHRHDRRIRRPLWVRVPIEGIDFWMDFFLRTSDRLYVLPSSCSRLLSLFCSKSRRLTLMNDQCLL